MPASPRAIPAHSSFELRCPNNRPNSKVNSGTVATAKAATPEATPACSATVTPPLPQLSSKKPIAPAARHCGQVGAGTILFNESGSHLCLPISATQRSGWGEDLIIAADSGRVETAVVRQKGPPARLAADWFGDHLLTHRAEVVDFFTGAVVDRLDLSSVTHADS